MSAIENKTMFIYVCVCVSDMRARINTITIIKMMAEKRNQFNAN